MDEEWMRILPELGLIAEDGLRRKIIEVYQKAIEIGGWEIGDLDAIPFSINVPGTEVSFLCHVRAVTRMLEAVYPLWEELYGGEACAISHDRLIAGALLHDVGKLVEYAKGPDGSIVLSDIGRSLRHPFSGTGLAMMSGIPHEICHIIAVHAGEGDGGRRSPEAVMVNRMDLLNFDAVRACAGLL